ncbi:MAG: SDR family NAD(P)-dependent oxidoreductase [Gammaproteobacteria bacterium]
MKFDDVTRQFRLDGRTAVITGIGPGIGETVARAYASAGANVVICARTQAKVEALAKSIAADGGNALAVTCDVGREQDIERLVAAAREAYGEVTVIFHNAFAGGGVEQGKSGLALTAQDWQTCLDANLLAPFRLAQAFVPDMKLAGRGSIINVLSTAGFTPVKNIAGWAYGATKAGLETLTRYMASECGPEVRANCICPGTIAPDGAVWDIWKPMMDKIPLKRAGFAREVAAAALYLASDASSFVTGQTIFVDGGRVNTAT